MRARTTGRVLALSLLCLGVATATVAPPSPAWAQGNQKEAANRFNKGFELFKEGDFQAALIEFKRAYDLAPNFRVLYNIGQVQFQLQDYAGALGSLERYLEEGGKQVPAARRKEVEKDIEKLRARVARVEITTNVPGAEITVDDVEVGVSPLSEPVLVSAGRRAIAASKEGRIPARKVIDVAGNDSMSVRLELAEVAGGSPPVVYVDGEDPPPPETPPADEVDDGEASSPDIPWGWWVATGVVGVASGVFGVLALTSANDLEELRESGPSSIGELEDASDRTAVYSVIADVLLVTTAVTAGLSIYLTVDAVSSSGEADASLGPRVRARVAPPLVLPTPAGVAVASPTVIIEGSF